MQMKVQCAALKGTMTATSKWGSVTFDGDGIATIDADKGDEKLLATLGWAVLGASNEGAPESPLAEEPVTEAPADAGAVALVEEEDVSSVTVEPTPQKPGKKKKRR